MLIDSLWHMGHVPRRPFDAPHVADWPAVRHWRPATVPGNVRSDLLVQGRIPDPAAGLNYRHSRWVEDVDWWYRRRVALDSLPPEGRAFLVFHGVDYLSAIFVNGREVARHTGMFSRQTIEVTAAARAGAFDLAVRVWGSGALPRRRLSPLQKAWQFWGQKLYRSWVGIYPDRTATLKCQMSFGWDFAPPVRAMGIWDDVELRRTGPLAVRDWQISGGTGGAPVTVTLWLDSARPTPAQAEITLTPANFQGDAPPPVHFSLRLPAGQSRVTLRLPAFGLKLWQPWERGLPHLYTARVSLTGPDGRPLDSVDCRTGFRVVSWKNGQLSINGRPLFARGLNWVPADILPGRLRSTDYRRLLTQARDLNANLLRVWGGGLREKRAFYDLADELGLLIWQEFPFACEFLGAFPRNREYLNFVERECGDIVRQLRHHPAVALWCGGNEFSRRRNRPLLAALARVTAREDSSRPFIPTSPGPADAHNWQVWHGNAPIATYRQETAPFLSEFGMQALPDNPPPGQPADYFGDATKLTRYAAQFNEQLPATEQQIVEQPAVHRSKFAVYQSQLAQAVALQTAIEHMRRRGRQAGGVAVWQFNEPWPAVSWSLVDYWGRPKLAAKWLKTLYAPLLVSLDFPVGRRWRTGDEFLAGLWIDNRSPQPVAAAQCQITLIGSHPPPTVIHNSPVPSVPAGHTACVGRVAFRLPADPQWLVVTLRCTGQILARNHYPLAWHDDSQASPGLRLRRWLANLALH